MVRRSSASRHPSRAFTAAGVLSLIFVLASMTPAASQATQGAIIGQVTDTSGAVLPGVTVIATGPALQVPQIETVSNERGEYRLSLERALGLSDPFAGRYDNA